jgi:hypothetical protein
MEMWDHLPLKFPEVSFTPEKRADASRVAATESGPWRKPWEEEAEQETSPGRGDRNNRPLQATLSPAEADWSVNNCRFPIPPCGTVGHNLV